MSNLRYRTMRASPGAGVVAALVFATPDDAHRRRLTGVFAGDKTTNVETVIVRAGYEAARIDDTAFALAPGYLETDLVYDPGIQVEVDINNRTGAGLTNAAITIRYELLD